MREYQEHIFTAVLHQIDWAGSNTVVNTEENITKVYFYGNKIAEINHRKKTGTYDHCGYHNACTTARINAVKWAVESLGYRSIDK